MMAEGLNGHQDDEVGGKSNCNLGNKTHSNELDKFRGSHKAMSNGNIEDKVCRDFLRKVCHRGSRCKFIHPESVESSQVNQQSLIFCHDFQNGLCPRSACRFIHCTVGEEDYYLSSGHFLPHVLEQAAIKGQILDSAPNGEVPICKDFLVGDCLRKRGGKCRFRHLTKPEYEHEVYGTRRGGISDICKNNKHLSHCSPLLENCSILPDAKRQRFDPPTLLQTSDFIRDARDREFLRCMDDLSRGELLSREMSLREYRDRDRELDRERDRRGLEEIILLRKQMEVLKKEVVSLKKENSDLRATNDFLLDKVTSLGIVKQCGTLTTVTVPTVSLASTIPVTSVRPLTAAQVSLPLSISSDCSVGSVVAINPQAQGPQQSLAPPTQQVAVAPPPTACLGTVGGVQVSLSQASALSAVSLSSALSAVSLPSVNLNTITPVTSMASSMAPPGTVPSIAQAMSMSGASGHLVTYPIMTQPGLRSQM